MTRLEELAQAQRWLAAFRPLPEAVALAPETRGQIGDWLPAS
ncbi:hypothetical protein [Fimbriimonas ginsengisoli]|uniref:Uncharacterized protein n=1 Tax=Fimbriimonas ginsengisoli Gsoil 348 TaxID=661478 RepID=A0A068NX39_FIMGI|nr:hypothetical protein [Fimbriimonas ginsengisoli]AIE86184.1 hypothetical protein OP10G_2816 [Fimbriimonas ginsengisoli Gsoil 348]